MLVCLARAGEAKDRIWRVSHPTSGYASRMCNKCACTPTSCTAHLHQPQFILPASAPPSPSPVMSTLFESATLVNKAGKTVNPASLDGKMVGVYFAARSCPHCKEFTPELAMFYNNALKEGQAFEIVFVSSDRDEATAKESLSEMPWLMLSFRDRTTKDNLLGQFGVRSIPTLIVLDEKEELLTKDGRSLVNRNIKVKDWCGQASEARAEGKEGERGVGSLSHGTVLHRDTTGRPVTGSGRKEMGKEVECASCGTSHKEGAACATCGEGCPCGATMSCHESGGSCGKCSSERAGMTGSG